MQKIIPLPCISAKVLHETQQDAERAARNASLRGSPRLYVYQCSSCKHWHLTSSQNYKR